MATQLKNLTFARALGIVESEERRAVTTPDAAKTVGRVLLAQKRNEERTKVMSEPTGGVVSVAKRSAAALEGGEIGQETFAKLQQRCAQEQFPNEPTLGHALAKFYRTPHGAEMLSRGLRKSYEDGQRRVAQRDADIIEKMNKPIAHAAAPRDTPDDDDAGEGTIDQRVERLMQSRGISRDEAISVLHRAEKVAKGFSF
jgi:cytochrome c5